MGTEDACFIASRIDLALNAEKTKEITKNRLT